LKSTLYLLGGQAIVLAENLGFFYLERLIGHMNLGNTGQFVVLFGLL